jgi:dynein heavy chain 1
VLQYNHSHADFPLPSEELERYIPKCLVYALLWSFAGDAKLKVRSDLGDFIRSVTTVPLPPSTHIPVIDYEVSKASERKQIIWNWSIRKGFCRYKMYEKIMLSFI